MRKQGEEKTIPKRVKAIAKKAVLPPTSVNFGGRTPVTRGKSKTSLEKAMEKSKKNNKERKKEVSREDDE